MDATPLSPQLRDLIERVAAHPHGLGFLHRAPLESVAITLGVDARVADEARRLMDSPTGRERMIEEVRSARRSGRVARERPAASAPPRTTDTAQDLIERARRHPLGIRFLLRAPLESVAVTLQAHPFLVLHARRLLHRRGRKDVRTQDDDAV